MDFPRIDELLSSREQNAIVWLWENRQRLEQDFSQRDLIFDFPDYGGMAESGSKVLSGDLVDYIQDIVQTGFPEKKEFFKTAIGRQS
jgi:hypothetical protein